MTYLRFVCSILAVPLSALALLAQESAAQQQVVFHVRLVQAATETQDSFAVKRAPRRDGTEKPRNAADFRLTNAVRAHILEENVDADSLLADELARTSTEKLHEVNYTDAHK